MIFVKAVFWQLHYCCGFFLILVSVDSFQHSEASFP